MGEEACETPPCDEAVPVLWCDEHLCVLDKPAGMPTHQSLGHPTGTLANVFAGLPCALGRAFRPVGRLDRDTSGLVSAAMHPHAAYTLAKRIRKTYFAVVGGKLTGEGEIDAPILTDPDTPVRTVDAAGQAAVTRWKALTCDNNRTLVALFPQTGRTHQLRVHMAHIGFPLLGDALYGGNMGEISRHALHCAHLCIENYFEEGRDLTVASPLPADMAALLGEGAQQQADRFLKGLTKGVAPC
jgi:23S rRNA pseudouridine1911/1915/1917 synthase